MHPTGGRSGPPSPSVPPAASWPFAVVTATYAGGMFWVALGAATEGASHLGSAAAVGVAVGAVAAGFAALVVLPPVVYGVAYGLATGTVWADTTTAVVVPATLLLLVFGTCAKPYVPLEIAEADLDGDDLVDPLDRHMSDWWGFTRPSASVVLAFGVGVAASLLQSGSSVESTGFVRLAVTTFLGVAVLWACALRKVRAVGARRRDATVGGE